MVISFIRIIIENNRTEVFRWGGQERLSRQGNI